MTGEVLVSNFMMILCIAIGLSNLASGQSTSGWQTLTDRKLLCKGKSPQDWERHRVGPLTLANGETGSAPVPPAPAGIARVVPQVDA